MVQILSLRPEDRQRLNGHALERFNDWQDRILTKAPQLRQLSIGQIRAHLRTYLHDNELTEFGKCLTDITKWLSECMDTGDRHFPDAYATWVIDPMDRIESLLITACKRAENERRKKEYDDRWCAAFVSMKPPTDDAEKYLSDEENDEFTLAMGKAVKAYLEKGTAYLTDLRTFDYVWWLEKIQRRKEEEARKLQAIHAADEYNHRLNQEMANLTSQLDGEKRELASYFRAEIQDRRYTDHSFDYILSKEDEMSFDPTLVRMANRRLGLLLSNDLRSFVPLPPQYHRRYFPLPTANYRFEKVPCIDISFDIFAAAYAEVWLKTANKSFNGYEFALPWMEDSSGLTLLEKPRFLGYYHLVLAPEDLGGYVFWRSVPLVLLKGLLNGETRPDGCTISAASGSVTTYRVQGFEKEVDVSDKFAEYLKSVGSINEMVNMGIMTEKVGNIVRVALTEMEAERRTPPGAGRAGRRDSMKEKAFQLFDAGKRPSDPEVKALGIKPNSAYRYHQIWKKACSHG